LKIERRSYDKKLCTINVQHYNFIRLRKFRFLNLRDVLPLQCGLREDIFERVDIVSLQHYVIGVFKDRECKKRVARIETNFVPEKDDCIEVNKVGYYVHFKIFKEGLTVFVCSTMQCWDETETKHNVYLVVTQTIHYDVNLPKENPYEL